MEKSWENFWATGKIEDYLTYRNSTLDATQKDKKSEETTRQQEGMKGTWDSQSL